jgi:hypothetical protein
VLSHPGAVQVKVSERRSSDDSGDGGSNSEDGVEDGDDGPKDELEGGADAMLLHWHRAFRMGIVGRSRQKYCCC